MLQKSETPPLGSRASRNSCTGCFRDPHTVLFIQAKFLIATQAIRPELMAMVAVLAFEGGGRA